MDPKDSLVRVTHYEIEPRNGPGQKVTRPLNAEGNPFVVFCSSPDCAHFVESEVAIPHWSEDCSELLGFLRCPACQALVVRPGGPY